MFLKTHGIRTKREEKSKFFECKMKFCLSNFIRLHIQFKRTDERTSKIFCSICTKSKKWVNQNKRFFYNEFMHKNSKLYCLCNGSTPNFVVRMQPIRPVLLSFCSFYSTCSYYGLKRTKYTRKKNVQLLFSLFISLLLSLFLCLTFFSISQFHFAHWFFCLLFSFLFRRLLIFCCVLFLFLKHSCSFFHFIVRQGQ